MLPDPRKRWGALILADAQDAEWLGFQLEALLPLVSQVRVVLGSRGEGLHFDGKVMSGGTIQVTDEDRRAVAKVVDAAQAADVPVHDEEGPLAQVLDHAARELGTYEVLVVEASEFLLDPVLLMQACERGRRATCFAVGVRQFERGHQRARKLSGDFLVACRPGEGFTFAGAEGGTCPLDLMDDELLRYRPDDHPDALRFDWRNPHPTPVQRADGHLSVASEIEVSIIVPFYGEVETTLACARAVLARAAIDGPRFELILRDDHGPESIDPSEPILQDERVRLSQASENLGFLRTVNEAAREAQGEFLVLLNNDTEPLAGWLEALLEAARADERNAVVGAQLLYPDGTLQEAGGIIFSDASGCNYGKHELPTRDEFHYRREVDYCSGAVLLVRRALWEELGGFDDRFAPAYYEDTDLCFEARARGQRVIYEPRARVVHLEGHTCGRDESSGVKRHQAENRERFLEKWGAVLASDHAPAGTSPHLARERAPGKHVAIVHLSFPMMDRDSGSFRLSQILFELRDQGHRVSLLSRDYHGNVHHRRLLEAAGIQSVEGRSYAEKDLPTRACVGARLISLVRQVPVDLAWLSHFSTTRRVLRFLRRYAPDARIVTDSVDLHYVRLRREAELRGDANLSAEARKTERRELAAYRKSDHVIAISDEEAETLQQDLRGVPISVVSNIHPSPGQRPGRPGREGLLFVGSSQHPPNRDAVLVLVEEVMPALAKVRPDLTLTVVGDGYSHELTQHASDRVRFLGFVDDLEAELDSHLMMVAPLRFGAGAKGKIGQALSYGLPVVTGRIGAEGMGLEAEAHYLHAEEPAEFVESILRLEADSALWASLAAGGVKRIDEGFSRTAVAHRLEELMALDPIAPGWRRTLTRLRGYA